ncbi:hypothetical protein GCM10022251_74290 [Phytohabitans flavus]
MQIVPTFRRLLIALATIVAVLGTMVAVSPPARAESTDISVQARFLEVRNNSQGGGLHVRFVWNFCTDNPGFSSWLPKGHWLITVPSDCPAQQVQVHIKRHSTGANRAIANFVMINDEIRYVVLSGTWDLPGFVVTYR